MPLIFNPDEDGDYCAWKYDFDIWQTFTKEELKWQSLAEYLWLKGRDREAVRRIYINNLKKDDDVEEIIWIFNEISESDKKNRIISCIKEYV